MVPGELATEHRIVEAPVVDGAVPADPSLDLAKAASIERHGGPGTIGVGFVQGLGLRARRGGDARSPTTTTTCSWSGMDDDDMLAAVARLRETGGGMVAVDGGEVIGEVRLPIAGLMSDRSVAEVADEVRALDRAYKKLGCPLEYPFMMVSFLSLGVIPALRLTNRGLVDGREFTLVDPVVT